jgi:hypothetical protein
MLAQDFSSISVSLDQDYGENPPAKLDTNNMEQIDMLARPSLQVSDRRLSVFSRVSHLSTGDYQTDSETDVQILVIFISIVFIIIFVVTIVILYKPFVSL